MRSPERAALLTRLDRATYRAGTGVDRVRTVGDFHLFQVERIRARVLRTVTHAIHGNVVVRAEAAQVDAVAVATATFSRTKRDARQRAENVLQAQQVLALDHCLGDDRHGLRRIQHWAGVLRPFQIILHFLYMLVMQKRQSTFLSNRAIVPLVKMLIIAL